MHLGHGKIWHHDDDDDPGYPGTHWSQNLCFNEVRANLVSKIRLRETLHSRLCPLPLLKPVGPKNPVLDELAELAVYRVLSWVGAAWWVEYGTLDGLWNVAGFWN